jgi:alginate O-acetyltransferase complex protein AlgI
VLFQSPLFVFFFVAVVALLFLVRRRPLRHAVLLLASYTFYAAWDPRFLVLIWLSTAVDFFVGQRLPVATGSRGKRSLLMISMVSNLGILGVFKYFDFFAASATDLAALLGVSLHPTTLDVVLPVGISFYTFQSMSYTLDIYRGRLTPEPSALRFALYVAFFPQLVAGPIVRASHFLPQLARDRLPRLQDLAPGLLLFCVGLFKKIAMADHFGRFADPLFGNPELYSSPALALGVFCYAAQIYCDFSGYSDMAIGLGRILGYRLPRNFERPYRARTPREFWRRWHISLSTWLRDYLYISLGGNRSGTARTHWNLFVTMLLGGLWHGANYTFLLWGALHGAGLSADRALGSPDPKQDRGSLLGWFGTMILVGGGWVIFRSSSLPEAALYFSRLLSFGGAIETPDPWQTLFILVLGVPFVIGQTRIGARLEQHVRRSGSVYQAFAAGALFAAAYALSIGENRVFIYFQF